MGLRGPKPKPTALKLAKGETRPSRVNYEEPELPAPTSLDPPAGLEGAGLVEWKLHAKSLTEAGVLRAADLAAFEDYCRALTELRGYEADAKKMGRAAALASDYQKVVRETRDQVARLRARVGLDPSSRSGVKATKPPSKQDQLKERFFGIPGGKTS
jgi:P27 family predicted phage terminase small subunit